MAMGKRKAKRQDMWGGEQIAKPEGHAFYTKMSEGLERYPVDRRLEHLRRRF